MTPQPVPVVLRARNLGASPAVRHGFSTRASEAGPGVADFDLRLRDDDGAVGERNRRRFLEVVGLRGAPLVTLGQTHEDRIYEVADGAAVPDQPPVGFDAVVTSRVGIAIAIGTADCLPVLMTDPVHSAIGAVHAGWRSAALGLPALTVKRMGERHGSNPADLLVALGPSIGVCCFEVGDDVIEGLAASSPHPDRWVFRAKGRKPHVDLVLATTLALTAAGVRPESIEVVPGCTRCDPGRFFSYRREGAATGRQLSVVGLAVGGSTKPSSNASRTKA
jgi:YfiH family protein